MTKLKRASLTLTAIILLLFSTLVMCSPRISANGNVLYVTENEKIQDAINRANPGDTIYVYSGVYNENIIINKSLTLIGENVDSTILDGNGSGSVITLTASNIRITGFTIRNSGMKEGDSGILMTSLSTNNIIKGNKITNNKNGIGVYISKGNVISNNVISNNIKGIAIHTSSENNIIDNTISENIYGIEVYYSYILNISGNSILDSTSCGIVVFSSSGVTIYHNNFIGNIADVQIDYSSITWSYKGEGNFWSRYPGYDSNQDGIGDSPYNITEKLKDPYPLMGMFSSFKVYSKGEEYSINVISNSSILNFTCKVGETGSIILSLTVDTEKFASGFAKLALPMRLMSNPLITLIDGMEIEPKILNVSDQNYIRLYITYGGGKHVLEVISSTVLGLYNELLEENEKLKSEIAELNMSYQKLLEEYMMLLANYSKLQQNYTELNNEYKKHLLDYFKNMQNIQNLRYFLAISTAAFLVAVIYLSRQTQISAKKI